MTPERLAQIEEHLSTKSAWLGPGAATDLCAALRAAWEELKDAKRVIHELDHLYAAVADQRDEARAVLRGLGVDLGTQGWCWCLPHRLFGDPHTSECLAASRALGEGA